MTTDRDHAMKSSFYDSQPGMATIENEASVGRERLNVSVHHNGATAEKFVDRG